MVDPEWIAEQQRKLDEQIEALGLSPEERAAFDRETDGLNQAIRDLNHLLREINSR